MKRSRFKEEQIISILQEAEAGVKLAELVRKHGISELAFYRLRSNVGGMEVSEAARLRELKEENWNLKRLVADQALNILDAQGDQRRKVVTPATKHEGVSHLRRDHAVRIRHACVLMGLLASTYCYRPGLGRVDTPLRQSLSQSTTQTHSPVPTLSQ